MAVWMTVRFTSTMAAKNHKSSPVWDMLWLVFAKHGNAWWPDIPTLFSSVQRILLLNFCGLLICRFAKLAKSYKSYSSGREGSFPSHPSIQAILVQSFTWLCCHEHKHKHLIGLQRHVGHDVAFLVFLYTLSRSPSQTRNLSTSI